VVRIQKLKTSQEKMNKRPAGDVNQENQPCRKKVAAEGRDAVLNMLRDLRDACDRRAHQQAIYAAGFAMYTQSRQLVVECFGELGANVNVVGGLIIGDAVGDLIFDYVGVLEVIAPKVSAPKFKIRGSCGYWSDW
jgi:hypothetical protein